MNGLYITSTGTDVGKTYVSELLLAFDAKHEQYFTASKPLISGWPSNEKDIQQTDTFRLLQAMGSNQTIDEISPWRFSAPLTPSMAAKKEGKTIDIDALLRFCLEKIADARGHGKCHLIEGVGGVMSPIWGNFTGREWIQALNIPCILVVGTYLSSISHTLTALTILKEKNIQILGVVANETLESSVSFEETCELLKELIYPTPLFPLRWKSRDIEALYRVTINKRTATMPPPLKEAI